MPIDGAPPDDTTRRRQEGAKESGKEAENQKQISDAARETAQDLGIALDKTIELNKLDSQRAKMLGII